MTKLENAKKTPPTNAQPPAVASVATSMLLLTIAPSIVHLTGSSESLTGETFHGQEARIACASV